MKKPPVARRPMTAEEIAMAKALGTCNFGMQNSTKRFAERIGSFAKAPAPEISENEAWYLRDCVYTYRKQIGASVVAYAGDVLAARKARREGAVGAMQQYEAARDQAARDRAAASASSRKSPGVELDLFAGGAP